MKSFLYIRWKKIFYVPLFILLIVSMATTGARAIPAQVFVDPPTVTIEELGENATVAINVSGVSNLYTYKFRLSYNTVLLDAVEVTVGPVAPEQRSLGPIDPETLEWKPIYDEDGLVKVVVTFLSPPAFTGSGTLAYITFNSTAMGTSVLDLIDEHTVLLDPQGYEITSYPPVNGEIVVVPEFPAILVMPLLLIATLVAAFLGKMFWSRKR
jgi:hypothetical protein